MLKPVLAIKTIVNDNSSTINVGDIIFMPEEEINYNIMKYSQIFLPIELTNDEIERYLDEKVLNNYAKFLMYVNNFHQYDDSNIEHAICRLGYNQPYSYRNYRGGMEEKISRVYNFENMVDNYIAGLKNNNSKILK